MATPTTIAVGGKSINVKNVIKQVLLSEVIRSNQLRAQKTVGATEVVRRVHKEPRKDTPGASREDLSAPLSMEPKDVFVKKPAARLAWLQKVMARVETGKLKATSVFDLVGNPKFVAGAGRTIGRQMRALVFDHIDHFSAKQQKSLQSDASVFKDFATDSDNDTDAEEGAGAGAGGKASRSGEGDDAAKPRGILESFGTKAGFKILGRKAFEVPQIRANILSGEQDPGDVLAQSISRAGSGKPRARGLDGLAPLPGALAFAQQIEAVGAPAVAEVAPRSGPLPAPRRGTTAASLSSRSGSEDSGRGRRDSRSRSRGGRRRRRGDRTPPRSRRSEGSRSRRHF